MYAFTVHPEKKPAETPAADPKPRRRRRRWLLALLLLLGLGGLGWAVRPDPHLARARELQKELFSREAKNLPPDQRKTKFEAYRNEMKQLTDAQKRELFAPVREKQKAQMTRYFAMSPQERARYLDEQIDRSEKMRKDREQRAKATGGQPGGPAGGFGFGPGGGPGGKAGGTPPSAADIEKRRKQRLDDTSPEERAQRDQFRRDMDARRRQRGLPPR